MSFLDNLENSLKSLERSEERGPEDRRRKEADRAAELAVAPWAEQLKSSAYTQDLLRLATRAGYEMRTKIHMAWIGTTLRLEAREKRLELRPGAAGVSAAFIENDAETGTQPVDLTGDPQELVRRWLA